MERSGALTPAVNEEESGHRARLSTERVPAVEIVASVGVVLRVHDGARHAPAVLWDSEVSYSAVALSPQRSRRRHHQAVLLHHEARLHRRRRREQRQRQK